MLKKRVENLFKKKERFFLLVILLFGLLIRSYNISDNIFFGFDQARDASRILEMSSFKDLKIVGPETDIPGVFNGPFFYYLLLPIYMLSHFNTVYVSLFMVIINISCAVLIYIFSKILFKDEKIGIIAAFLWSISYAQISFAKYISNASLMIPTSIVFFLGCAIYFLKKKNYGLLISVIGLGLAIQSNVYLIYLGLYYVIYYFIYRPKLFKKVILINLFLLFIFLFSFFASEVKWNFQGTKTLFYYIGEQGSVTPIIENFSNYIQKIAEAVYYSFFSFNLIFAFLLLVIFILWNIKKTTNNKELRFLYVWIFSTIPLFAFSSGVLNVQVVNTTIYASFTLLFAYCIGYLLRINNRILGMGLLTIIVFSNIYISSKDEFKNVKLFMGESYLMRNYKELIDYTYQHADGREFSICSITAPLFINTLWGYLYELYGKNKYGYLPYWTGPDQLLHKNFLLHANKDIPLRFLIIQDDSPEIAKRSTVYLEDQSSKLIDEKRFGGVKVQKRMLNRTSQMRNSQNITQGALEGAQAVIDNDPRYSCDTTYEN